MVRKFELQVYDEEQNLIDRFVLDKVTSPRGLGFVQDVSVIDTNTFAYITSRSIAKKDIELIVNFQEPNSYLKSNSFRNWYAKYIQKNIVLKYDDTVITRYMQCYIKNFNVSEINSRVNSIPITITPLSPFYLKEHQKIVISYTAQGKTYPFSYPYFYGGGVLSNNVIDNVYFDHIPLSVKIFGKVTNPIIVLRDAKGTIYSEVRFNNFTIYDSQYLLIDAISSRILVFDGVNIIDRYDLVDKNYDTFLLAQAGKSTLEVNLDQTQTGFVEASYIQFVV